MPKKSTLKLPPLDIGSETLGQRIARLRKERGFTQKELADKIGLVQYLISDYETDRRRMYSEMVIRFARALEVDTDVLLGNKKNGSHEKRISLKIMRRLKKIEKLPPTKQKSILHTIDLLIKAEKGTA